MSDYLNFNKKKKITFLKNIVENSFYSDFV
jgi:hypothetical protein